MKYDPGRARIEIGCREFVLIARRHMSPTLPFDEDEPARFAGGEKADAPRLCYAFSAGGAEFLLLSDAQRTEDGHLFFRVAVDSDPEKPRREIVEQARGEAFLSGLVLNEKEGKTSPVTLEYNYENEQSGECRTVSETIPHKKLVAFFERCRTALALYAAPETDRVTKRLPTMKKANFPYAGMRDGQNEFLHAVYRNLARGTSLYACAPTGTGKTVSTLFPGIRALGDGRIRKLFYFTPKTTTAQAVRDCLSLFSANGVLLRAAVIVAKEKICPEGLVCREGRALCPYARKNRLADALRALYEKGEVMPSPQTVRDVAVGYEVCPYELSLSYAEIADIVVCDLNYLFDPAVSIRRFFTDGGDFGFLIDEAHNLVDRARSMYSAKLSENDLRTLLGNPLTDASSPFGAAVAAAHDRLSALLFPYVKEELREGKDGALCGFAHTRTPPSELYEIFGTLLSETERALFRATAEKNEENTARVRLIRDFYYTVRRFADVLSAFDDGYEMFLSYADGTLDLTLFCINPAKQIAARIAKGHGAVFFSATLTPLSYYRSVLGGDGSSEVLEVASPFTKGQLSVSVMDKISLRYSERERTLPAVLRVVAATVSARRGNYMIFSPSFAYSEALAAAFSRKYPKIRTLVQKKAMTDGERRDFLSAFEKEDGSYLVAFCVMGGIYSEGIDLFGDRLIGCVVVGIGMPTLSPEREAIRAYFDERADAGTPYAYLYPGLNRVLQAAGRVIRREDDRGAVVLIDDRFDDPLYRKHLPALWSDLSFVGDAAALRARLDAFWQEVDRERERNGPAHGKTAKRQAPV